MKIGGTDMETFPVGAGCMRFGSFGTERMAGYIHAALECGVNFFDHADVYADGRSESVFGDALAADRSIRREDLIVQTKCGICPERRCYDLSKEHILRSVDGSLARLRCGYLDFLLLHRPDALADYDEIAEAFRILRDSGKVRHFGVSNHNPGQIRLLRRHADVPVCVNQLQLSVPVSSMISAGLEVNMTTPGAVCRDGGVLDYCRLEGITVQAWSPFQMPDWRGCFINSPDYGPLNKLLWDMSQARGVTPEALACAWILRHPARIMVIAGTADPARLRGIAKGAEIRLSRDEWYAIYLAAGHILP